MLVLVLEEVLVDAVLVVVEVVLLVLVLLVLSLDELVVVLSLVGLTGIDATTTPSGAVHTTVRGPMM